ncbi:MAG TPA: VirB8/TrbF family protein [Terriglobales bacterium]|jgi:type IV secretion system protein VirB5|nr:VirB8/TrbF family protein [Terriglobales bacterium]
MKNEMVHADIVATEIYTSHYTERRIMRALIYVLAATVLLETLGLLHLADKHVVYRYIRINEMGQAAPISYNDLDYSPREGEIRTFLTEWATDRYARLRDTVAKTYPRNFYFLSDQLANQLMADDVRNRTIAKVIAGQMDENDLTVNNVVFTSLGKERIRNAAVYSGTAIIDCQKVFSSGTPRKEHWQMTVTFYLNPDEVSKRSVNFPQFATFNPLGLIITDLHEARAAQ